MFKVSVFPSAAQASRPIGTEGAAQPSALAGMTREDSLTSLPPHQTSEPTRAPHLFWCWVPNPVI